MNKQTVMERNESDETYTFFTYVLGDGSFPHRVQRKREQFLFPGKLFRAGILCCGKLCQREFQ